MSTPTGLHGHLTSFFVDAARSGALMIRGHYTACMVVTLDSVLEAQCLPQGTTSQRADLYVVIWALTLAQGKRVNIYTDFKYAFLIAHSHSAIWQERGFLTTKGNPIVNVSLSNKFLQVLSLPAQVAIIHCRRHQSSTNLVAFATAKAGNSNPH